MHSAGEDREFVPTKACRDEESQTEVQALFLRFLAIESACEKAIENLEVLSRRTVIGGNQRFEAQGNPQTISDMAYIEFREAWQQIYPTVNSKLPGAVRASILNISTSDLEEINRLNGEILKFRSDLFLIEQSILNAEPVNALDAVAKLRFISGVLLDGSETDPIYFAHAVEECIFMIAPLVPGALSDEIRSWQCSSVLQH